MKINYAITLALMAGLTSCAQAAPGTITSPDGKVALALDAGAGVVRYRISFQNAAVIEASRLGMTVDGKSLGEDGNIGKVETYSKNETYAYRGVHSKAINHYNGARIAIDASVPFSIEARVFNDGVAFRYLVASTGSVVVDREQTEFILPASSVVWSQDNVKYYEGKYVQKRVEDFKPGDLVGPPMTIVLPGGVGYAAITEGGLTDYAGMSLVVDGARTFRANLTGTASKHGKFASPWRIVEIGKDLNTLVNSDIIANVSPPLDAASFPAGYASAWLKPGRSVWSWLTKTGGVTLANMKRFSDQASALGFEYNLVDEGWGSWKDGTRDHWDLIKELVDYSAARNVKIWVWKAYPDRKGIAGLRDPQARRAFFKKCQELGVVGLKIDFFDSESQEIINFYQAALKDAAEFHLMLNFHGANKPTGESRTWPNEMTREAIRGMENRPPWGAANSVLPFTRYVAGHADYTPVHLGDRAGEVSWAHHVASMVVFTSPFLCIGADPQSILDNPARELMKSIPAVWDETIVLPQSKIGDLVLMARRSGSRWFLAAMNGTHEARSVQVDLGFLKRGVYKLYAASDNPGGQAGIVMDDKTLVATVPLTLRLNAEGGFVGRFELR